MNEKTTEKQPDPIERVLTDDPDKQALGDQDKQHDATKNPDAAPVLETLTEIID